MIEALIEKENSESEAKKWESKLNKEDIKVYIKRGGSHLNSEQSYVKAEILFNSYF